MKNTETNNKLIAEFMGVKPLQSPYHWVHADVEYEMYGVLDFIVDGVDEKHFFRADELEFHKSWDWLMPVVEKIYQLDSNADFFGSINLEATYKEVVGFIKQHNAS